MSSTDPKDCGPTVSRHLRVAALAAVAATLGDFGQLWTVAAGRTELAVTAPPEWLLVPATLAGALGIPFYALGYRARAQGTAAEAPLRSRVVGIAGTAFAVLGGTVHAVTGVLVHARVGSIASGLDPLAGILASGPIVLSLWAFALAAFLVAAGAESALPQPAAERLAGPLVLTILVSVAAAALPLPWRDIVQPAAVNIAHVLFFARLCRAARPRLSPAVP